MTSLQDILTAAQALPPSQRAQLIAALWENTDPSAWVHPSSEWIDEAGRRSDGYDAGKIRAAPWSEVRERARRKAGLDD
jgi:putative addiction module component (TIGR02574 family)